MQFTYVILYLSVIIWMLPAIRQIRGKYSLYFIILALSDPLNFISVKYLGLTPNIILSIAALALFYSIDFSKEELRKHWMLHLIILVMFISLLFTIHNLLFLMCFFHILILYKFLKVLITSSYEKDKLNIFHLILVFYELSVVINLFVLISNSTQNVALYFLTLTFQLLIAVFFTIFKEENSAILIPLKTAT